MIKNKFRKCYDTKNSHTILNDFEVKEKLNILFNTLNNLNV